MRVSMACTHSRKMDEKEGAQLKVGTKRWPCNEKGGRERWKRCKFNVPWDVVVRDRDSLLDILPLSIPCPKGER